MTIKTIDNIKKGDSDQLTRTFTVGDIKKYADVTGDSNPIHMNAEYAQKSIFGKQIVQGILVSGLVSAVIGTKLPGAGSIYLNQNLFFKAPVFLGDTITAKVIVDDVIVSKGICKLKTLCTNQHGSVVIDGDAVVMLRKTLKMKAD